MPLFDINAAIGRVAASRLGFDTPANLLAEMDRLRIDQALVHHQLAAEGDVDLGNRMLLVTLRDQPRLHPCWVILPAALGDLPDPAAWIKSAQTAGVRAVRLLPRHSLFTPLPWCVSGLCRELEKAELLLLLDFGLHHWSERVIPWDQVDQLCQAHPRLPVVVIGVTTGETRDALALLPALPNLHLDYHAFNPPDLLRRIHHEGLSERFLFGTGLPIRAGECVVEQIRRSALPPEPLAAIGYNNAARLLRLPAASPEPHAAHSPRRPRIIDAHAHCGAWERTITPVRDTDTIIKEMDRCGIDAMIVSSFAALHGEMRAGNQLTAGALRQAPGRLFGYAVINPHYPEEIEDELRRCFGGDSAFVGLKLHCGLHAAPLDHPGYERALRFANEHEMPVLIHGGEIEEWREITDRYSGARFLLAHACAWDGFNAQMRDYYAQARDIPNLYLDVAGSAAFRGALRALIDLVGLDKVLFGSDFPMFDLAFELGRITGSTLSDVEKDAVCRENALRIFNRLRKRYTQAKNGD